MITLTNIVKSYGSVQAVDGVTLTVEAGELLVLLGESGCGKTTTLKMINRLIERTSGTIEVDGKDVHATDPIALRRSIGYVFQGVGLFPHMTVRQNAAVVPELLGWNHQEASQRVDELLDFLNLPAREYASRYPSELSGGQRQRIGLARALAARPKVMLMDEPFGAVDPINRDMLQNEFRKVHESLGLTTVMVTHDMTEALLMADRIAVMNAGRLVQHGTPQELLNRPAHAYVESLMTTPKRQADRLEELSAGGPS